MAKLTPLARLGKENSAIGARAKLSDEAVLGTQVPLCDHSGGCQLHEPLEGRVRVLLQGRVRGGDGLSLGPTESRLEANSRPDVGGQRVGSLSPERRMSHSDSPSLRPPAIVSWQG